MVCPNCRKQEHDSCIDLPRLKAARKGRIPGVTDPMASRLCDCGHITVTDLAAIGIKEVVE
jgi:hypothetical protein